jgi:hypothetical protein
LEEKKQTEKMKVKRQKGRGTRLETELEKYGGTMTKCSVSVNFQFSSNFSNNVRLLSDYCLILFFILTLEMYSRYFDTLNK